MAISEAGTFDYVAIIPEGRGEGDFECPAGVRADRSCPGLAGISPLIRVANAGPANDAGLRPPWSLRKRSRITFVPTVRGQARTYEASFYIDKALTDCIQVGDEIHLVRTGCGGLGFSVIRSGKLVAAAGALTAVPLGLGVEVRIPSDLISRAESVFQQRDPKFKFGAQPLEVKIGDSRFITFGGNRDIDDYRITIQHGFLMGPAPGTDESVSICQSQVFPYAAGTFSLMLMESPGLSISY